MSSIKDRRSLASSSCFEAEHLQQLKPLRILNRSGGERFVFLEFKEIKGTPFALNADEERFVYGLLDTRERQGLRKHNLWVFRSHQQKFAGDFVVVDMSRPLKKQGRLLLPDWDVFVLDVKMNAPLKLGGGGAGIQFKLAKEAAQAALEHCAEQLISPKDRGGNLAWRRALSPRNTWLVTGSRDELLGFFRCLRHLRKSLKRSRGDWNTVETYYTELKRSVLRIKS